jgi:hypothetical protein
MAKPDHIDGYDSEVTEAAERVLVTLLRGLGPWKESVFLVGGLTPRYLVPAKPAVTIAHARPLRSPAPGIGTKSPSLKWFPAKAMSDAAFAVALVE